MISEVDEDFTVFIALENFTVSSRDGSSVTLEDVQKVSRGNISTFIVDVASSIDVN